MNDPVPRFPEKSFPPAATQNKLIEAIGRAQSIALAGGLEGYDGPLGRMVDATARRPIFGRILSGTNPYDWEYVSHSGGGSWDRISDGSGNGNGLAWELNGYASVPTGKVVELHPGANGDWRFQFRRAGSPEIPSCDSLTFHALGCFNYPLTSDTGITTVSVWTSSDKTTPVATGTADSSGTLVFTDLRPKAGSYYWEASHSSGRFNGVFGTSACGSSVNITFAGRIKTEYICMPLYNGPIGLAGGFVQVACGLPIKRTLHYSDPIVGDVTLTYDPLQGFIGDAGSIDYGGCVDGIYTCDPGSISVKVGYNGSVSAGYQARVLNFGPGTPNCPSESGSVRSGIIESMASACAPSLLISLTTHGSWDCSQSVTGTITE